MGDGNFMAIDLPAQSLPRLFRGMTDFIKWQIAVACCHQNRRCQWVLGIAFQAGGKPQDKVAVHVRPGQHLHQFRAAIGQRTGLIENRGLAGRQPFQHRRIPNDNPAPGGD